MKLKTAFLSISIATFSLMLFQNCGGKKSYNPTSEVVDNSSEGVEDLSEDEVDEKLDYAESACNNALVNLFSAVSLADGSSIKGFKNGLYQANHLSAIEDGFGNVVVTSSVANASVDSISNFKGNVVLCGLDVDSISDKSAGNVYVVDGNVGDISSFIGNVVIRRGSFTGDVTYSKMNLLVLSAGGKYDGKIYNQDLE